VTLAAGGPGLARGTYTAIVPIVANGIDNSPQNIAVTYRVLAEASIVLSRTTVPMAGTPNSSVQESVDVTNGGDRPLTGLTAAISYTGSAGWLSTSFSQTAAPSILTLTANTGGLATGTYNANVSVSSTIASVAAQTIAVQLTVGPGPAIQLSSTTVNIAAVNGANPAPTNITVKNAGGGTLSGLTLGPVTYTLGQSGWLNPVLNGVTAETEIQLNVTSAGLANGNYSATFEVRSNVASNTPVTATVNLSVGDPPAIMLSNSAVVFATWSGGNLPGAQEILITNGGGGTLTGLDLNITYTSAQTNWLGGNLGATAPTNLSLKPTRTNLPVGTHTASVMISSTITGVAPRTVTVSYVIQSFTVNLYDGYFTNQGCAGCHSSGSQYPIWSSTASTFCNTLGGYVNPANPSTSVLVCKLFGACPHGMKFNNASFEAVVTAWITAGAPCS
jgi:hypothetical protein